MNVALFHMFMTFMTFMTFTQPTSVFCLRFNLVCQRAKPAKGDVPTAIESQEKTLILLVNIVFVFDC